MATQIVNQKLRDHPPMPRITARQEFVLPIGEIQVLHSRSSGAGGQNVNKVNTKVTLRWSVDESKALTPGQKEMVKRYPKLRRRVSREGILTIAEQGQRSQAQNLETALERLTALVKDALAPVPERTQAAPPQSRNERRLRDKKSKSAAKENRRRVELE